MQMYKLLCKCTHISPLKLTVAAKYTNLQTHASSVTLGMSHHLPKAPISSFVEFINVTKLFLS